MRRAQPPENPEGRQDLTVLGQANSQALLPDAWQSLSLAQIATLAPLQRLTWRAAQAFGVEVWVRREDLLHPHLGGNKFYKLFHHLERMRAEGKQSFVTFGGAWSNHICAAATAAEALGLKAIGVIRGERPGRPSITLRRAEAQGMHLHFVSREAYRSKDSPEFRQSLRLAFDDPYVIAEGGGDEQGARGVKTWMQQIRQALPWTPDAVCVAVGTGATVAGMLAAFDASCCHGFLALKGSGVEVQRMHAKILTLAAALREKREPVADKFPGLVLHSNYHYGGYGKYPRQLAAFADDFTAQTHLPIDRVYTAKLFAGLEAEIACGRIRPGARVLVVHTGGLQAEEAR